MLALVVLMGAAVASKPLLSFTLPAPRSTRCTGRCAEQYRLPLSSDTEETAKDRAMAEDGTKCNVVGAQRCLSKRRTILRSTEDPMDTLRGSFLPQ